MRIPGPELKQAHVRTTSVTSVFTQLPQPREVGALVAVPPDLVGEGLVAAELMGDSSVRKRREFVRSGELRLASRDNCNAAQMMHNGRPAHHAIKALFYYEMPYRSP